MEEQNKDRKKSIGYRFGYICGCILVACVVLLAVLLTGAAAAFILRYIF